MTTPRVVTRAGWQCPECRTCYPPDVQACHCATAGPSLADRIHPPVINLGNGCTCTPFGVGTVRCPVHQAETVKVIC